MPKLSLQHEVKLYTAPAGRDRVGTNEKMRGDLCQPSIEPEKCTGILQVLLSSQKTENEDIVGNEKPWIRAMCLLLLVVECFPQCMGKESNQAGWSWSPICHKSAGRGPRVSELTGRGPPNVTSRLVPVPRLSTKMTTNILTSNRGPPPIICQIASGGFHFHRDKIEQTNLKTHRHVDTVQGTNPLLLFGDKLTRDNPCHSKEFQVFFSAPLTPLKGQPASKISLPSQCPIVKSQVPIVKSSIPLQPECYSEAASLKNLPSNKELQGATKSKSSHIPLQDEERNLLNTIWNTFTHPQSSTQVSTVGCRGPPSVTSHWSWSPKCHKFGWSWSPECLQSPPSTLASNRGLFDRSAQSDVVVPQVSQVTGRGPPSVTSLAGRGPPNVCSPRLLPWHLIEDSLTGQHSRMLWSPKCHKSLVVVPQVSQVWLVVVPRMSAVPAFYPGI